MRGSSGSGVGLLRAPRIRRGVGGRAAYLCTEPRGVAVPRFYCAVGRCGVALALAAALCD